MLAGLGDVVDDEVEAAGCAGLAVERREAAGQTDRARRARRCELHDTDSAGRLHVMIDVEAQLVGVERLGRSMSRTGIGTSSSLRSIAGRLSGMIGHLRAVWVRWVTPLLSTTSGSESRTGASARLAKNGTPAVDELLGRERLVTITGSGGSGKTRLAAHAAATSDRWRDGVWWIELQAVSDRRSVANVIASGVGVLIDPIGGPLRSLARHLRDRRVLVCLDNCEHVVAGAAEAVEALIASCPDVTVLVTSREPLGVPGETVWRLPTLVAHEAVELFVDRARHVGDDFTVGPGDEVVPLDRGDQVD
jgi:AAA domain